MAVAVCVGVGDGVSVVVGEGVKVGDGVGELLGDNVGTGDCAIGSFLLADILGDWMMTDVGPTVTREFIEMPASTVASTLDCTVASMSTAGKVSVVQLADVMSKADNAISTVIGEHLTFLDKAATTIRYVFGILARLASNVPRISDDRPMAYCGMSDAIDVNLVKTG